MTTAGVSGIVITNLCKLKSEKNVINPRSTRKEENQIVTTVGMWDGRVCDW